MMHPHHGHAGGNAFMGAIAPLASIIAIGGTVYFTPQVAPHIEGPAFAWLSRNYSPETVFWLFWGVKIGLYPLAFLALRTGLIAAFMSCALFFARRLI